MRESKITRNTGETNISLSLKILDKSMSGKFLGTTGVGFMDHMLTAFCVHGHFYIELDMTGDLIVDDHHSVEDLGIVLGTAFSSAMGDKSTLTRYGASYVPMDEALSRCVLDISGRPYLVYNAHYEFQFVGELETAMVKEFLYAFAMRSGITLHIENLYGDNDHHKVESIFKAFARALSDACELRCGDILSTKGKLD